MRFQNTRPPRGGGDPVRPGDAWRMHWIPASAGMTADGETRGWRLTRWVALAIAAATTVASQA